MFSVANTGINLFPLCTANVKPTNSGVIVKDAAHLCEVLQELYTEFQTTGKIACESVGVEKYSRKIQVEKLAELVRQICGEEK